MPTALALVSLQTIRRWEHRMDRWVAAYDTGLDAKEAQQKVREFSSRKYTSHRRVPETLAAQPQQQHMTQKGDLSTAVAPGVPPGIRTSTQLGVHKQRLGSSVGRAWG
ncbi:hypothetical protein M422DRAFT_261186 [Sphaerobolus stellatus SS14]|uniref:Uncharacterized protein n=1 Tax=Sphaerobolus stellatus (strain SS14) TaxID=990650 RepID=A0A0C9U128_SPHS4|nr:hypothetical protein M422DRAFT_261186 [Sphaerobolus stellatus SS14]